MAMNQWLRLIIGPALIGLIIAALILSYMSRTDATNIDAQIISTPVLTEHQASEPVSYASAVNKAAPAVVNIYTTQMIPQQRRSLFDNPFFKELFGNQKKQNLQRMQSSLGSGVFISDDGYLLTNNHVIANADEIVVALRDGREGFATIVGTDPDTDLAVLKVDIINTPTMELATSSAVVGDVALAIGNPFGVGQTVTMGIISATGRNHLGITKFEDFIQTDAAINPGNSGGALINAYGQLIGINTAIFSQSGGSHGIGFAIPVSLAKKITQAIIEHGSVIRGWLGIEVQQINDALSKALKLKQSTGIIVTSIYRNGPAHVAGLKPGDILLQVDQIKAQYAHLVMKQITEMPSGKTINISILRDNNIIQLQATIGVAPASL